MGFNAWMQFSLGQCVFSSLLSGTTVVCISTVVGLGVTVSQTTDVSVNVSISVVASVAVANLCCVVNLERRAGGTLEEGDGG